MKATEGMHRKVTQVNIIRTLLFIFKSIENKERVNCKSKLPSLIFCLCPVFFDGRVIFVEEAKPRSDIQRAETKPQILRTWELS